MMREVKLSVSLKDIQGSTKHYRQHTLRGIHDHFALIKPMPHFEVDGSSPEKLMLRQVVASPRENT
jgi:hypothetical protein